MFNAFFDQYLETLLWSSSDLDTMEPLDNDYGVCDFDESTLATLKSEALDYFYSSRHLWYATPESYNIAQHGHDFALTRNGHGAGYWDRGLGSIGEELTKSCKCYGSIDIYAVDGILYAN